MRQEMSSQKTRRLTPPFYDAASAFIFLLPVVQKKLSCDARYKIQNSSVDAVFESILNGDVSEAELSDNKSAEYDQAASESLKLSLLGLL